MHAGLERVINATGVLLHTNLGRAPLPVESIERIAAVASGYCNLELDAELGVRSRRGSALEHAMAELVGAEQALLVNNNAAAVLLALTAIAGGREVIVSRGELVEIGGGFRIPEVLERSGATLVEVGTTNRTRVSDYAAAISERTACILRVHPSNFKVTGFTERPALAELVALAHARGLALVKDLGGGLLVDLPRELAASAELGEPTVQQCLRAGTDLVCFSLDKLFGGPQGGVVCGSARWISALKGDPLARALRVDKLTLAALEPIVRKYALGQIEAIPVHAMLRASIEGLFARAQAWRDELAELGELTSVIHTQAAVGGGTLAEAPLGSAALRIDVAAAEDIAAALRRERPPVIGRIADDRFLLDARTVLPGEDEALVGALTRVLRARQAQRP
jgi:L-seryl-tRNA(Ser) seleniumtransferase